MKIIYLFPNKVLGDAFENIKHIPRLNIIKEKHKGYYLENGRDISIRIDGLFDGWMDDKNFKYYFNNSDTNRYIFLLYIGGKKFIHKSKRELKKLFRE